MHQPVYTRFGKGVIVAYFQDGTVCVRLDSGGGVVLLASEVFGLVSVATTLQSPRPLTPAPAFSDFSLAS
jgi:hypothetical protein